MTKPVDYTRISCNETSNRSQRLREGAHDKVNLTIQSKVVAHAPTLTTKHTNAVCLVHHDTGIILFLQFYNLRQLA